MFSSEAYGQKNLLFKDATSELVPIATQTYEAWLGREYLHAMKGLLCDPNRKSTCLFPYQLLPNHRHGRAFWRGAWGRTLTPEVCPSASMGTCHFHLPASLWGSGEETSLELHGLLYPRSPACSRGWGPGPQGLSWEGPP